MAVPRSGIKKIVVGVDGSEHSEAAIDWAARMARGMGSEVIAVFAISPPVYFDVGSIASVPPPQFDPEWRAEMKKEFERDWCKGLSKAGVKYRTVFEDGHPSSVITQVADRVNADLIVVGRRGRGGVAELVLGSVSHQLVLHSKRPVLVIEAAPTKASRRVAAASRSRQPANSKAPVKGTKRRPRRPTGP
jgi:nucleotide-binding universal stress UspA family protein